MTRITQSSQGSQRSTRRQLKTEWLDVKTYHDHQEANTELFKYIEMFYNSQRRHAALGYVRPNEFEQQYAIQAETAA